MSHESAPTDPADDRGSIEGQDGPPISENGMHHAEQGHEGYQQVRERALYLYNGAREGVPFGQYLVDRSIPLGLLGGTATFNRKFPDNATQSLSVKVNDGTLYLRHNKTNRSKRGQAAYHHQAISIRPDMSVEHTTPPQKYIVSSHGPINTVHLDPYGASDWQHLLDEIAAEHSKPTPRFTHLRWMLS